MELFLDFLHGDGTMVARLEGARGNQVLVPAAFLGSRGLPPSTRSKVSVETDLGRWRQADFDEYAFAFRRPIQGDHFHAAWSFVHTSHRYVVPALAVLRALASPSSGIFPRVFRPQSLEDVCWYDSSGKEPRIVVDGTLGLKNSLGQSPVANALSWFYCFPSARQAWASVYVAATNGGLSMELPKATFVGSLAYECHPGSNNRYVTAMTLHRIIAHEEPLPFAEGHTQTIDLARSRAAR